MDFRKQDRCRRSRFPSASWESLPRRIARTKRSEVPCWSKGGFPRGRGPTSRGTLGPSGKEGGPSGESLLNASGLSFSFRRAALLEEYPSIAFRLTSFPWYMKEFTYPVDKSHRTVDFVDVSTASPLSAFDDQRQEAIKPIGREGGPAPRQTPQGGNRGSGPAPMQSHGRSR